MNPAEKEDLARRIAEYDSQIEMWQEERDKLTAELHPPTQTTKTRLESASNEYFKRKIMERFLK